ncbi:hypothetical protein J4E80_000370 [Alternaria sp. BMP 0032]|nr:hypothetical protein J4E80_000370 [Alternaria sp. BMP 0032]
MSKDRSKPTTAAVQNDGPQPRAETSTIATSESTAYPTSDTIKIPDDMAELWLKASTPNTKDPVVDGEIIAVRRLAGGDGHVNFNYLLGTEPPTWYWPKRVSVQAREDWRALHTVGSVKLLNLVIKSRLDIFDAFLVVVGNPQVDPLHAAGRMWPKEQVGKARSFTSLRRSDKTTKPKNAEGAVGSKTVKTTKGKATSTRAFPKAKPNSSIGPHRESGTISAKQMLEAILVRAAKRPSWWSAKNLRDYSFYEEEHYDKAQAVGLETPFKVHNHVGFPTEWEMEYIGILLRFVGEIDPSSPVSIPRTNHEPWHREFLPSKAHEQRPPVNPTKTFKVLWKQLERMSVEDLLDTPQEDREDIVSLIVYEAPHTLHDRSWVLLLVLTLVTKEHIGRCLQESSITVGREWYVRSCRKLLLQLKESWVKDIPHLESVDVHAMWQALKQDIQEDDVDPDDLYEEDNSGAEMEQI